MSPAGKRGVLGLVELCYGCVADPQQWPAFLAECGAAFGAATVSVGTLPVRGQAFGWLRVHGLTPAQFEELLPWALVDPRAKEFNTLAPGEPFNFDDHWNIEGFKRSPYYAEFQRKLDVLWCVIARLDDGRDLDGLWALHRRERERPFDAPEAREVGVLARHIGRARRLQLDLEAARVEAALAQQLLDRLPCGLLLLGADGRVAEANRSARDLLATGDGLALKAARLECLDDAAGRGLAAMVHAAARGLLNGVGGVVAVPRPSGKADYVVSVARCVGELARALGAKATVVVTVADPARAVGVDATMLRRLWDLTAAEAQLALALADGATLEEIASRTGISQETARVHLKRTLAKSGTHRQSELVRLILTGPGSVW